MDERLNRLKLGLTGALGFAFTTWRLQIVLGFVLVALMATDWITGTRAAKRNGTWSSKAAREGFDHKIGAVVVLIVAVMADIVFTVGADMMDQKGEEVADLIAQDKKEQEGIENG